MSGNLEQTLFSPIGREYCVYFFWLTVIAFIFFALVFCDIVVSIVKGKGHIWRSLVSLIFPFLVYFNNRLLYSMCVN